MQMPGINVQTRRMTVVACEHQLRKMSGLLADGTPFYTYPVSVNGSATLVDAVHRMETKCHGCGHEFEVSDE